MQSLLDYSNPLTFSHTPPTATLTLTNRTSEEVLYKLQTRHPSHFRVSSSTALLPPHATTSIKIVQITPPPPTPPFLLLATPAPPLLPASPASLHAAWRALPSQNVRVGEVSVLQTAPLVVCQPPQLTFRAHERCEAELKLISLSDATLLYKIQTRHRDEFRFKPAVARLGARETACVKVTRVRSAGGGGRLDEFRVLLAGGGVGDTKGVESVEDVEELWISMPRDKIFSIVVGLRIMEAEEEGEKKSEALGVGKEGGILRRCSCLGGYL